jgi:hypothetical protein
MSDVSQGPGWWLASDGKWYPPHQYPGYWAPPPPAGGAAGAPYLAFQQYPPVSTNGLAIASLVLSIFWLGGLASVLAIIFGIVARRQIRSSGGRQGGDGVAVAGLVIGIVGLVAVVLFLGLTVAVTTSINSVRRNAVASCQADAKSLETALAAYRAQNGHYPPIFAPWSSTTYATNYSSLTQANTHGGPWLKQPPGTGNYVIEFDSNGHVWVNVFDDYSGYSPASDFSSNALACNVAI